MGGRHKHFEDWMLKAVIKNFKLREQEGLLYNRMRTSMMTNAFILGQQWSDVVNIKEKLNKVSKDDMINFANKYFKNNYVVVYKENGERSNPKVEKPEITQVQLNRDTSSVFAKDFYSMYLLALNLYLTIIKTILNLILLILELTSIM